MTESLAGLTGLPDGVTVNGHAVLLYPLTMADIGAWNRWARQEALAVSLAACVGLPEDARREAQRAALVIAQSICFGLDEPGWSILCSHEGAVKAIELSLAHGKEKFTSAAISELFQPRNGNGIITDRPMFEALNLILVLSGFISQKTFLEWKGSLLPKAAQDEEKKTKIENPPSPTSA